MPGRVGTRQKGTFTWRTSSPVMVAAVALLLVAMGCGGSGTSSTPSTATSRGANPLDPVASRLHAAGIKTEPEAAGDAQAKLSARARVGEESTSIAYYVDPHRAAVVHSEITGIFARHPGKGLSALHNHLLLFVANQNGLAPRERATFRRVAAVIGKGE